MTAIQALRTHWQEYLIEGWALGSFMVAAGVVATALGSQESLMPKSLDWGPMATPPVAMPGQTTFL